ncbi:GntR family transcriptional regulator [Sulfitobacter sp. D35]|uniref:GntR family transcriptional regulator n=1 Tax=Sulfitobacter sp. D35 TaxID=3083252 RepID=UPI00296E63CA|nr:GntR family transcriptional regulator [Sulfitobacter sp. D35]MDW4499168.1 GntR family transcriptional regulator [Sulfitobacter sp. D35]
MDVKRKVSRVDEAYDRLKSEIRTNAMPPGFQATEPEIALRLGMSRTPIREALIRLDAEGLVELKPRHGARVLPISAEDMREIYGLLISIEPDAAADLAALGRPAAELRPLEKAMRDMEQALDAGSLDDWAAADDRFHQTMLELSGNKRREAFVKRLFDQVHRARIVTLRLRKPPVQSTEEHRDILEQIKAGNVETARRSFRAHRERTAAELMAILVDFRMPQL